MSYTALDVVESDRMHPRKQEILDRIMKRKNFRQLYIKLCATIDNEWIDRLSLVLDKMDQSDGKGELKRWIISNDGLDDDILECLNSYINNFCLCFPT
jgi:hypothetical protein